MIQKNYTTTDYYDYCEIPMNDHNPIAVVDELIDFGFIHKVYSKHKYMSWRTRSENFYANMLLGLSAANAFNGMELTLGKTNEGYGGMPTYSQSEQKLYYDLFKDQSIDIPIFGYGYNNGIFINSDLFSFLSLNIKTIKNPKVSSYIVELLDYYRLPPIIKSVLTKKHKSEYDVNEAIIKLMHYSIQYKRNRTI